MRLRLLKQFSTTTTAAAAATAATAIAVAVAVNVCYGFRFASVPPPAAAAAAAGTGVLQMAGRHIPSQCPGDATVLHPVDPADFLVLSEAALQGHGSRFQIVSEWSSVSIGFGASRLVCFRGVEEMMGWSFQRSSQQLLVSF